MGSSGGKRRHAAKGKRPLTGWRKTGICPSCKTRAVTGGACLSCGWESSVSKRRTAAASKRRRASEARFAKSSGKPSRLAALVADVNRLVKG